ncbi:DUF1116 domain-containing protein [Exiguobacterium sp. SH0S2]|uniref:DUF1116 domain-containing protein n=1 Tax=Exiguobacterium sp. SH0S2 TaxID=2510950 RepID=UPI00103D9BB8|nr:DUF1116 domain-containing protein [Exiguobacterium sp. SH0S2]TCI62928.1 DUF1116 domain-containing protein [Exiguobacterium sp. SH0S2]
MANLFDSTLHAINIGASTFSKDIDRQGTDVVQYDWSPPAGGDISLLAVLDQLNTSETDEKNAEAVAKIKAAHPMLVGINHARYEIPGMHAHLILHAGPPVEWRDMCGPMQGAVIGALLYEGLATTEAEARELAASGDIEFAPCHEHDAVGPMAGVISPSMPVHIIENVTDGNRAYCTVNEGLGKVLRFGAFSDDVLERLRWIEKVYMPALQKALDVSGAVDLRALIAQALHMGDECHNRNKAATSLFLRDMLPAFLAADMTDDVRKQALAFIQKNEHYFLNLSMPAAKASLEAGHGIKGSTIVTAMARNGVDFGIRVSGLDGWFTAKANYVEGLLFPGYTVEDAAPDLGDSAITETLGIGGFAMGGAPAIVQFVGGAVEDALDYSRSMYTITEDENNTYSIPTLDFRGTPLGIDVRKVIETGVLPVINTGMAHREAGIGQVGAGIVHPPLDCFTKALKAYSEEVSHV